jgi:cytosine/adenosine deaminase-related metal-dependent hydrolase
MAEEQVLTARWVFPVSGPPLENGTVTVRGETIDAVEPKGSRTADVDLGNAAIIPGLVNAHTHLDLSGARGAIPPSPAFVEWLRRVVAFRHAQALETTYADILAGVAELMRCGTTLIGDINSTHSRPSPLATDDYYWSVDFFELIGLSHERTESAVAEGMKWASKPLVNWRGLHRRRGLSPHAPYSFHFEFIHKLARIGLWPLAIHLAESLEELELLEAHRGPFVPFLAERGAWVPSGLAWSPEHVLKLCEGKSPVLLIHCNYLSPDAQIPPNASIVYCPRTHAAFGHPPHPFREFLRRGVRVCLGTDSLASNPDLDILAEARFVHERYPDFPGDQLLRMIALSGAEALGWAHETGSLEPDKSADFVVLPLPNRDDADPYRLVFESDEPPGAARRTMWCGRWRELPNDQ